MSLERQVTFWVAALAVLVALLWLLSDVLLPFIAGMALAYLLDPLATRLERLGFPALRAAHLQLLSAIGAELGGVRLSDLVTLVSLPKQTVGDLIDELETMRMVERFQDPDHGVIKRVRLGPKGKVWQAEVKRV